MDAQGLVSNRAVPMSFQNMETLWLWYEEWLLKFLFYTTVLSEAQVQEASLAKTV